MGTQENRRPQGVATKGSINTNGIGIRNYLLTIKNNAIKYTSSEELVDQMMNLVKKMKGCEWNTEYALELDKQQRLHLHTCFTKNNGRVNPASYRRKGWTIHFDEFDDYDKAKNYMNKQDQSKVIQQQRDAESYYHYNYGFI